MLSVSMCIWYAGVVPGPSLKTDSSHRSDVIALMVMFLEQHDYSSRVIVSTYQTVLFLPGASFCGWAVFGLYPVWNVLWYTVHLLFWVSSQFSDAVWLGWANKNTKLGFGNKNTWLGLSVWHWNFNDYWRFNDSEVPRLLMEVVKWSVKLNLRFKCDALQMFWH